MMARSNQTADWANRLSPSLSEIESLAIEAYAHLPETFRALCGDITIQVSEFPDDQIIEDMGLESPFDLLGLFEGTGIGERFSLQTGEQPNRITIYRRAVLDYWAEYEEALGDIVTHILIHEIGHHFGLSDEDMERIEATVE
jgi:predicted Zn-dependent protease with MMP-like domain